MASPSRNLTWHQAMVNKKQRAAFIPPFRADRDIIRNLFEPDEFFEIQVKCSLDECRFRDPKGLYKKAMSGNSFSEFKKVKFS